MQADPLIGQEIAGYRIEALIGRGGMSTVYRAEQLSLKRKVALKLLATELATDDAFRARFLQEAQLAATLEHPNLLPIHEVGEAAGSLFIAMRLVEGTDLGKLLAREGRLSPERTIELLRQAASVLDFAHGKGLIHRDVKPANLLLADDRLYLADFGIARPIAARRELTRTGSFVGTIDYAAPEQIQNEPLDQAADIYSLGCVLYQCLTGKLPFDRPSAYAVMRAHLEEPAPAPSEVRPELPKALDDVVGTALAKQKDERYRSGRHLVEAMQAGLEGRPVAPAPRSATMPGVYLSAGVQPTLVQAQPTLVQGAAAGVPANPTLVAAAPAMAPGPPRRRRNRLQSYARVAFMVLLVLVAAEGMAAASGLPEPISWAVAAITNVVAPPPRVDSTSGSGEPPTTTATKVDHGTGGAAGGQSSGGAGAGQSPGPAVPIIGPLGCTSAVQTNQAINCSPSISGTTLTTTYKWTAPGGSPASGAALSFTTSFGAGGNATIGLEACNATACATGRQTVNVAAPPTQGGAAAGGANQGGQAVVPPSLPPRPNLGPLGCTSAVQTGQAVACFPLLSGTTSSTTYRWSAPGGSPSAGSSADFSTSFGNSGNPTIMLRVCNASECSDGQQTVRVTLPPPQPSSLGCTSTAQTNQIVNCSPSVNGAGTTTTYAWSAPGGSPSSGSSSSFSTSFAAVGVKTITLVACNAAACSQAQQPVTIILPAPIVSDLGCTTSVQINQTVSCSPSVSGAVSSYSWSVSGGSPSNGSGTSFSTSFGYAGSFTVSLQACNPGGCGNGQQNVSVSPPPLTVNSLGCGPLSLPVNGLVSCSPSVSGTTGSTTYRWSANGGSPSVGSGSSFSASFGSPGTFTISLETCNGSACASGQPATINVQPPTPFTTSIGCSSSQLQTNQTITCYPQVSGTTSASTYYWSASGGSPSTGGSSSFSISFSSPGTFIITLGVCNGAFCSDQRMQTVYVTSPATPPPVPAAPPSPACNIPSKTDINPSTGKAYAVNPSSGVWDDNYWANVVEPALKRQYCGL